jgi:hypothetical protein
MSDIRLSDEEWRAVSAALQELESVRMPAPQIRGRRVFGGLRRL